MWWLRTHSLCCRLWEADRHFNQENNIIFFACEKISWVTMFCMNLMGQTRFRQTNSWALSIVQAMACQWWKLKRQPWDIFRWCLVRNWMWRVRKGKKWIIALYFFDFVLLEYNKPIEGERVEGEEKDSGGHWTVKLEQKLVYSELGSIKC